LRTLSLLISSGKAGFDSPRQSEDKSMSFYCGEHGVRYEYSCPRCETEKRHEELIDLAHESDHRRANPGEYDCPECRYQTLKYLAGRCPKCHAQVSSSYWDAVNNRDRIERQRAEAAAAEWERDRPRREAKTKAENRVATGFFIAGVSPIVGLIIGMRTYPMKEWGFFTHILFWDWTWVGVTILLGIIVGYLLVGRKALVKEVAAIAWTRILISGYWWWLLPLLSLESTYILGPIFIRTFPTSGDRPTYVPGLNWLIVGIGIAFRQLGYQVLIPCLGFWAVVGGVLQALMRSKTRLLTLCGVILLGLIGAGVVVAIFDLPGLPGFTRPKTKDNQTATVSLPTLPAAKARIAAQPCTEPWTWATLRPLPNEGVGQYLCPGWESVKSGGGITVTTPNAKLLHEGTDEDLNFGSQPQGVYVFRPDSATGSLRIVRIKNRWTSEGRVAPPTCARPWTWKAIPSLPIEGISVHLCPGWEVTKSGGGITITTPDARLLHENEDETIQAGAQPEGIYVFRRDSSEGSAREVRIKNRW